MSNDILNVQRRKRNKHIHHYARIILFNPFWPVETSQMTHIRVQHSVQRNFLGNCFVFYVFHDALFRFLFVPRDRISHIHHIGICGVWQCRVQSRLNAKSITIKLKAKKKNQIICDAERTKPVHFIWGHAVSHLSKRNSWPITFKNRILNGPNESCDKKKKKIPCKSKHYRIDAKATCCISAASNHND